MRGKTRESVACFVLFCVLPAWSTDTKPPAPNWRLDLSELEHFRNTQSDSFS